MSRQRERQRRRQGRRATQRLPSPPHSPPPTTTQTLREQLRHPVSTFKQPQADSSSKTLPRRLLAFRCSCFSLVLWFIFVAKIPPLQRFHPLRHQPLLPTSPESSQAAKKKGKGEKKEKRGGRKAKVIRPVIRSAGTAAKLLIHYSPCSCTS